MTFKTTVLLLLLSFNIGKTQTILQGIKVHCSTKDVPKTKSSKNIRKGTFTIASPKEVDLDSVKIEVSKDTTVIISGFTGSNGWFAANLPDGSYNITAIKPGYYSVNYTGVTIFRQKVSYINLPLELESAKKRKK